MTFRAFSIYAFAAIGGLLFGYDAGIISGALLFIDREFGLTPLATGIMVSAMLVGCAVGALASGRLSDLFGRRRLLLAVGLVFLVGSVGAALSVDAGTLTCFRLVLGLAAGTSSVVVPTYLSELAPAEHRGKLSSLFTLSLATGLLAAVLVAYALSGQGAWRWMLAGGAVPALIVFVGLLFQPESPRWLVAAGRADEARTVLVRYRGAARAEAELEAIRTAGGTGQEPSTRWRELFTPGIRPVLVMAIVISAFSQLMGNGAVVFYGPTILAQAGFGDSAAILGAAVLNATNLLAVMVGMVVIDRLGRRPLLLIGGAGMAVSLAGLGLLLVLGVGQGAVLVMLLALYMLSFGASWGGMPFVLASEVFPMRVRGAGMGTATVFNWLASLAFSLTFPLLLAWFPIGVVFLAIAAICVAAVGYAWRRVPETRGRTLEEIEFDLHAGESSGAGTTQAGTPGSAAPSSEATPSP